jgi:hypothetical protein
VAAFGTAIAGEPWQHCKRHVSEPEARGQGAEEGLHRVAGPAAASRRASREAAEIAKQDRAAVEKFRAELAASVQEAAREAIQQHSLAGAEEVKTVLSAVRSDIGQLEKRLMNAFEAATVHGYPSLAVLEPVMQEEGYWAKCKAVGALAAAVADADFSALSSKKATLHLLCEAQVTALIVFHSFICSLSRADSPAGIVCAPTKDSNASSCPILLDGSPHGCKRPSRFWAGCNSWPGLCCGLFTRATQLLIAVCSASLPLAISRAALRSWSS